MGFKIKTAEVEQPAVEQEVVNVEKPQGLQNQNASTVDQTSGASSSEDSSSEQTGSVEVTPTDPPKTYEHPPIETFTSLDIKRLRTAYPDLEINKKGTSIEVTNIETGATESFVFGDGPGITMSPDGFTQPALEIDKKAEYDSFKIFAEGNSEVSDEAKYVYQMTGLVPKESTTGFFGTGDKYMEYKEFGIIGQAHKKPYRLISTVERELNKALDQYAEDITPGPAFRKTGKKPETYELLMNKKIDYNDLSGDAKEMIDKQVIDAMTGSGMFVEGDIKSVLGNNKFIGNVNYNRDQAVSDKMINIAELSFDLSKDKVKQEFELFKNQQQENIKEGFSKEQKIRAEQVILLRKLTKKDQEIREKFGEFDMSTNGNVEVEPGVTYQAYVGGERLSIPKLQRELGTTLFNNDGSFNGATEAEQEPITFAQYFEYLLSAKDDDYDLRTVREKYEDVYNTHVLMAMKNKQLGDKRKVTISPQLFRKLTMINKVPLNIINEIASLDAAYEEDVSVTFNQLAKIGGNAEFFKENQLLMEVEEDYFREYVSWLGDKKEHEQAMLGSYNVMALEELPDRDDGLGGFFVNFARNTVSAFQSSDFYFGQNPEQVRQTGINLFGRDNPDKVLTSIKASFDEYNERNPDSPINLTSKQEEAFKASVSELTSAGLGGMVPFLFEMFVIGAATEGVGIFSQLGRVGKVVDALILEEFKMGLAPSTPFEPGVGATFAGLSMLANKIPIKAFSKYFTGIRPVYEKVIRAGWVGAGSSKVNELVQVFAGDLMGHTPWRTEFENVYGDLFDGDDEAQNEFVKGLLVDAFIFGISGVSHMKFTGEVNDFMSIRKKKEVLKKVSNDLYKDVKTLRDIYKGGEIAKDLAEMDPQAFVEFIKKNKPKDKETQDLIKRIEAKSLMQYQLGNMLNYDLKVVEFTKTEKFGERYADPVMRRLTKNAEVDGLKAPKLKYEFLEPGDARLGKGKARAINKGNGEYLILFDRKAYNAGRAAHELQHLVDWEYSRRNPEAKENINSDAKKKGLTFSKIDKVNVTIGEKQVSESLLRMLEKLYPNMSRNQILELEYKPNLIELFSNRADLMLDNPYESASFFGDLLDGFKSLKRTMGFEKDVAPIRTVEDLMLQINNLVVDLSKGGKASEATLDIMEAIAESKIGEKSIVDIVNEKEISERIKEKGVNDAPKDINGKVVVPTIAESKNVLEELKQEVINEGTLIGQDKNGQNQYKSNESTAQKIVAETFYKVDAFTNSQDFWTKHGFTFMPSEAVRQDVAGALTVKLVEYARRYDGRGSIDGYINWALNKQFINACREAKVFDKLVGDEEFNEANKYTQSMGSEYQPDVNYTTPQELTDVFTDKVATRFQKSVDIGISAPESYNTIVNDIVLLPENYLTTKPISKIYDVINVPRERVVNEDGSIALSATELGKKQQKSVIDKFGINKEVENADNILKGVVAILPARSSVPYGEMTRADGSVIVARDAIAGKSLGIQTKILESPLYIRKGRELDPQGNPIYEKIKQEDLTPEKLQEIRDYFTDANVRNNATKLRNLIYQVDKGISNGIYEQQAQNELQKSAIAAGSTQDLMSAGIIEEIKTKYQERGLDIKDLELKVTAFVNDDMQNLTELDKELIISGTLTDVVLKKNGLGFSQLAKQYMQMKETPKSFETFETIEEREKAQDEHAEQFIKFVKSPYFSSVFNAGKFPSSDAITQTLPFLLAKFNDAKRTAGNAGSARGKKVAKALEKESLIPQEILDQNPEFAKAIEQLQKDVAEGNIEAANSIVGANTKTQQIFNIVTGLVKVGGQLQKQTLIELKSADGKDIIWNPDGTFEFNKQDYPDAVEFVSGNSKEVKISLINKVYDPKIAKALRNYDFVINTALSEWYKSIPEGPEKVKADKFLYRHFQMTTNTTYSDRAYAPFLGATIKDGFDFNAKKGEHIMDASMNTFMKFRAIKEGWYNKVTHDMISSEYFQLLTDKKASDLMDKEIGRNNTAGLFKIVNIEPSDIYSFAEGKYYDEIIARETLIEKKVVVGERGLNSNDIAAKILEGKRDATLLNVDRYIERASEGKDLDRSQRSKLMARAIKKTKEAKDNAIKLGLNIIEDGTGAAYNATSNKIKEYRKLGYDVHMVFVNTSLEVSKERANRRTELGGREVEGFIVERTWNSVQQSAKKYKKELGAQFYELDNSNLKPGETPKDFIDRVNSVFAKDKVVILMAGSPGAGKSTVIEDLGLSIEKLNEVQTQFAVNRGREDVTECSIGDFDDNIAFTECKVIAKKDGKTIELDANQFNSRHAELEKQGYTMSYEQFDQVIGASSGPAWKKWTDDYKRLGKNDMYVMTARASGSQQAIFNYLKQKGFEIPLSNIVTTQGTSFTEGPLAGENKKAAEVLNFYTGQYNGKQYNKINFTDDYIPNTDAVKFITNQLDVTGEIYTTLSSKDINSRYRDFMKQSTGLDPNNIVSYQESIIRGEKANKTQFILPYSAEDFNGLLYTTLAKGKQGEAQYAFYKETLLDPYARGIEALERDMVAINKNFKQIKKSVNAPKNLDQKVGDMVFTNQDAVRVYLWNKSGREIPGLNSEQQRRLVSAVENSPSLKSFAERVLEVSNETVYSEPGQNWTAGTITTDLMDITNQIKRKRYLGEFLDNKAEIFNEENLNFLRAQYGTKYVDALNNTLKRMELGTNRLGRRSAAATRYLDIVNNTNGVTMFINARSAVLQTISAANYVNWSFNNPLAAGAAVANVAQYSKDFLALMNDPFLVSRRDGNKINISENEIAEAAKAEGGFRGMISYLLDKGYIATKYADSFAIASGGATYYRNRIKDLMKNNQVTEAEAMQQARQEWIDLARESQQSGDPSKISEAQASDIGRLMLAFANTPMQYARIQKRAVQDIMAGRGDTKANFSKLLYYGFVQSALFNGLQQALFAADEDNIDEKLLDTMEGMIDTQLRGFGLPGNATVMVKNVVKDVYDRSKRTRPEYVDAAWKVLTIAPGLNTKVSRFKSTGYHMDKTKEFPGPLRIDNPALNATTNFVEGVTNVPIERVRRKLENLLAISAEQNEMYENIALLLGWPKWQILDDKQTYTIPFDDREEREKQRESFFGGGSSKPDEQQEKQRSNFGFQR